MYKAKFIDDEGELFTCVEQYYLYRKALFHGCLREAEIIKRLEHPKAMKRIPLPSTPQWYRDHARTVMYKGLLFKFQQNPEMKKYLSQTKRYIGEASLNKRWGTGVLLASPQPYKRYLWTGENWIGELLVKVRDVLCAKSC